MIKDDRNIIATTLVLAGAAIFYATAIRDINFWSIALMIAIGWWLAEFIYRADKIANESRVLLLFLFGLDVATVVVTILDEEQGADVGSFGRGLIWLGFYLYGKPIKIGREAKSKTPAFAEAGR